MRAFCSGTTPRRGAGPVWVLGEVVDGEVRAQRVTSRSARRGTRILHRLRDVEVPLAATDRPDLFLRPVTGAGAAPAPPPVPHVGAPAVLPPAPVPMPRLEAPMPRPLPQPRPVPIPIDQTPQYGTFSDAATLHVLSR